MGITGSGGVSPQADGTSDEFFQLVPKDASMEISVPKPFEDKTNIYEGPRRVVLSCENHQNEKFDFSAVGIAVCFNGFCHIPTAFPYTNQGITYTLKTDAAWRDRTPVNLAEFLKQKHDKTVLAIIDMNDGELLAKKKGDRALGEIMVGVIRAAQAFAVPIFDVYCENSPTHKSLRDAIEKSADSQIYPHHRTFEKPGTGGACTSSCLEVVSGGDRAPFTTAIRSFDNVIVMGFDASICVGKSVFGGWKTDTERDNGGEIPEIRIRGSYEKGILDYGKNVITSWQVLSCGSNTANPLCSAYLKYRN